MIFITENSRKHSFNNR